MKYKATFSNGQTITRGSHRAYATAAGYYLPGAQALANTWARNIRWQGFAGGQFHSATHTIRQLKKAA